MDPITLVGYAAITFLSAFWAWVHGKRFAIQHEVLDLTHCTIMSLLLVSVGISIIRYVQPDFFSQNELRDFLRGLFLLVSLAWFIHTAVYVKKVWDRGERL